MPFPTSSVSGTRTARRSRGFRIRLGLGTETFRTTSERGILGYPASWRSRLPSKSCQRPIHKHRQLYRGYWSGDCRRNLPRRQQRYHGHCGDWQLMREPSTWRANVNDIIAVGDGPAPTLAAHSSDVVAIGDGAMNACSTFTGCSPLPNPIQVNDVVAIGDDAASFNLGSNVIAVGHFALGWGTAGGGSGNYNQGSDVIAIGQLPLVANTTGSKNVAVGGFAGADGYVNNTSIGNSNQTGSNNTWIGYDSGPNTTTQLTNSAAFGYQAHNTASNQIVLGNSSMTTAYLFGTGTGCLSASAGGLISGSGSSVAALGGGGSIERHCQWRVNADDSKFRRISRSHGDERNQRHMAGERN